MEEIKVFSGNQIEAMAFIAKLRERDVEPIKKDGYEAARLAGFGNSDAAIELYVTKEDYDKIKDLIS